MGVEDPVEYRIKKKSQPGPNCMWEINRPDLGFVGTGYIFETLVKSVAAYRRSNGLPIGLNFEHDLEQALCDEYPDTCVSDDPRARVRPVRVGLKDLVLGTKVMASFVRSGMVVVDREEADRRSAICLSCRFNVEHDKGCGGHLCGALLDIVKRIVPQGTSSDKDLKACGLCHCLLTAAVWIPDHIQWDPMSQHDKAKFLANAPEGCWKCASERKKIANGN
jgi:hypothetical protein